MPTSAFLPPFNLKKWIDENRHLLRPPVGNQVIYKGNQDFMVMVVGGPNARKDFHINRGEELFYQLEGDVELHLMLDDEQGQKKKEIVHLREGDFFLLPPSIPHGPRRGPGTIGLVLERYRQPHEKDGFQWYCENCEALVYELELPVSDIVGQLPVLMDNFFADPALCTCKKCGTRLLKP